MVDENLIERQKGIVKPFMSNADVDGKLTYHNWSHVSHVIKALREILSAIDLSDKHKEDLLLAAIWHDADYAQGAEGHELRSADLAVVALAQEGLPDKRLERVRRLILSTRMGYEPQEEDEWLIKDADLAHLGGKEYLDFYQRLYEEIKTLYEPSLTQEGWRDRCVSFMQDATYYSKSAKKLYDKTRLKNIQKLKEMNVPSPHPTEESPSKEEKKRLKAEKKRNEPKYNAEKGIETMFRISLKNHITLSRIADDKANTLISVNAIILSIVLSALFPKLDSNPWLVYPGMSLILVSIITIILATLSTIPKTTHGTVSRDDVGNKKGNLLFFGNFHKMSLPDYEWGIGELMKDGAYLYGSLTRDLYFLGLVLNRKYSLLRYGYFVFVVGLMISIILFVWSILTLAPEAVILEMTD